MAGHERADACFYPQILLKHEQRFKKLIAVKVVIAGGGFAGVNLAERLLRDKRFSVTIVDRNDYNYFPPLLYQVATGFLDASAISYPFRKLFRNERLSFRMAGVVKIAADEKKLYLDNGVLGL